MSNLSILERNVMHQWCDCPNTQAAFLKALDKSGDLLAAERFAHEFYGLFSMLGSMLRKAANAYDLEEVPDGLLKFILDRHWHMRFSKAGTA